MSAFDDYPLDLHGDVVTAVIDLHARMCREIDALRACSTNPSPHHPSVQP